MIPNRFYILGCQRSGTTLMKLALECHSMIECHDEHLGYQILSNRLSLDTSFKGLTGFKVPRLTEQLAATTCVDHDLPSFMNPYAGEPLVFVVRDVRDTVASMVTLTQRGKRWLEEWGVPSFEMKMANDQALRARCLSTLKQFEGHQDYRLVQASLYWRYKVESLSEYKRLGYPLRLVRYEDLVSQAKDELSGVCEFLGLPWEADMLQHHERSHSEIWRNGLAIGGTNPRRPIDTQSVGAWRRTFTRPQVATILSAAGVTQAELYLERDDTETS